MKKRENTDHTAASKPDMTPLELESGYKTVIFLLRHGQSVGNAKNEFLGHTDKDMSELGYAQAARTAEFLAYERIDAVYSSDLMRAYNTALPHAVMRNMKVNKSSSLRELHAGCWEDRRIEDIISEYPHEFIDVWTANFGISTPPGGEGVMNAAERIYAEILKIAKENEGKSILIGCHAAAIRAFWGKLTGTAPEALADAYGFPENASVSVVYFDGKALVPGEYSHSAHLADLKQ